MSATWPRTALAPLALVPVLARPTAIRAMACAKEGM